MKLWQKQYKVAPEVEKFTVGKDRELDLLLAPYDILGSMAHAIMLESIGILSPVELESLLPVLQDQYELASAGKFTIDEGIEDVHSQVELILTRKLGDTGKKIHTARSRNDQVLLDLKLFMRDQIRITVEKTKTVFDKLIDLSEKHKEKLLPGYTHMQLAMPSSFGLWFGAYAESFVDDLELLKGAFRVANRNPLGSAAGYGTSFPIDRQLTTDLLGFEGLNYNVVYAQLARGKTERFVASGLAGVASTLSRFAMDVVFFMNQNFGFITFPDELTTGSSIMPHKKNPDVFELIRAKCNRLQALPNEIALTCTNLPSGYHRDMQIVKENFLPAFNELNECLDMAAFMLDHIIVKDDILSDDRYKYLFTVETVNRIVLEGVPFREAYREVSREIAEGTFAAGLGVSHSHEGSIGNLCNSEITQRMVSLIDSFGFEAVESAVKSLLEFRLKPAEGPASVLA